MIDVLIAGGGPVGVTLAILLAQRGVRVVVVDKAADIYPLPRAAHIDHETLRILQEAGVAAPIVATSRTTSRYDFRNARGKVLLRFGGSDAIGAGGWPMANMIHQPSIEAALRARLAACKTASLMTETELVAFREDAAGVIATVATPGGTQDIRAHFLIGADGARSPVRTHLGIACDDLGFDEPWLVVDALVADPARLPAINLQICDPARPTTCVVMGNGRHRWEFMILPGEDPEALSSDAAVWRMLKPWQVEGAITIERKAIYTFRARVAQRWRSGRVLLAGDAAHQTPPFAGQGLCAGVRDAANLAWKLAAVIEGRARPALLDSYQQEREPHARAVIGMAIMMGRMVCITSRWGAFLRDTKMALARLLGKLPDGPPAWPPIAAGIVGDRGGGYFPQFVVDGQRLDDHLGAGEWLFERGDARAGAFAAAIDAWLDAQGADAVLVRPDRHVFGLASGADAAARLRTAWGRALGRKLISSAIEV